MERFRFVVPGRLEYRDAARAFLAYVCERLTARGRLPADIGHRIISAFVEAFNNAVIHAYKDLTPGPVEVELAIHPTVLSMQVCDQGRAFLPEEVPEPDLEALPEGGYGLYIIREFMDRMSYASTDHRNVLTMEKDLRAEDPADEPVEDEKGS